MTFCFVKFTFSDPKSLEEGDIPKSVQDEGDPT